MDSRKVIYNEILDNPEIWELFMNRYKEVKAERKREIVNMLKQKVIGIVSLTIGLVIPYVLQGDITASVFFIPFGIYMLFTQGKVFEEIEDNE